MRLRTQAILVCLMCTISAIQAQTRIGYTNGTFGRENVTRCGNGTLQGMAIRLDVAKLQLFKGKTISGISVVYGSRNTEGNKARVFVTRDLAASPIVEQEVTISRATTSWTDVQLTNPYVITGEEEALFVGTDMNISNTYQALSFDFSQNVQGKCYVINNDAWTDAFDFGAGCPNIQLLIDGEVAPIADLMLKGLQSNGYYKAGTEYDFSTEVFNFGTETINSMNVEISVGDKVQSTSYDDLTIEPGKTFALKIPAFVAENEGEGTLNISVTSVNGTEDADATDNIHTSSIFFYPSNMQRSILVEEFTSQYCVNCPAGQTTLSNILQSRDEDFIKVMHHSGYQPDAFTMKVDEEATIFYGSSSTFAPAVMLNRMICPQQSNVPVLNIGSSLVNGALDYIDNQHPYASLQLLTDYEPSSRELRMTFSVYCHKDMPEGDNVMNILLLQDGVVARQTGGSDEFVHHHICRGSLVGDAFGISLPDGTKQGASYSWEKTIVMPESILSDYWEGRKYPSYNIDIPVEIGNMNIVAYVGRKTEGSFYGHQVYNVIEAKIGEDATHNSFVLGIDQNFAPSHNIYNNKVYDIRGNLVGNTLDGLRSGLYIIRSTDGTTKKVLKR